MIELHEKTGELICINFDRICTNAGNCTNCQLLKDYCEAEETYDSATESEYLHGI
jgi:hypothetical protein